MPLPTKTYPCEEHGEVTVPVTELMVGGKIDVFPEVTGRGYFDIDFRRGSLVLIAKSYIGLIPLNERVSIHVTPRLPVDNVLYLVERSTKALQYLPGYYRTYDIERLRSGHAEGLFTTSLLRCLVDVKRSGLMRHYVSHERERGWRGRLLLSPTINRFASKGIRFQQVRKETELSVDIQENQFIKDVLSHVIRYFAQSTDGRSGDLLSRAGSLAQMFDGVSNVVGHREELARQCLLSIKKLPGDHKAYERVLWLCYLITTRQGVSIESFGPARIETMVINVGDVFEGYVRQLIRENVNEVLPGSLLRDGNKYQVRLFAQGSDHKVKPDIFLEKAGHRPVVLDAKYKPSLRAPDRYEIIAFCEALQSKLAIFVSPSESGKGDSTFVGKTLGGIEMHEVRIDLSAEDMSLEERHFVTRLRTLTNAAFNASS